MISFLVRIVVFVSAGAMLVACNQQKPTSIEKACISEGSKVAECRCMGDALKKGLPRDVFNGLEAKARSGGPSGLANAMLELSEIDRHKVGTTIVEACSAQEVSTSQPVGGAGTDQPILSPDEAMGQACQINGNTPQMCTCWAKHLKENVSTKLYNQLAGGAIDSGNAGLTQAVQALNSQDQMSVGLVMMEAGQICAQAE
ncbi:hypothetical protein [Hirschia litorea]|uniref:Uncharacterized protein n=1 Tax=Hirschia litorea TaxID=1199156 RepID=A0ABW2IJQ3_9PROT